MWDPSTNYHPQTDGQTEIVNKWVEGYLRNYVLGFQNAWIKWLYMGEFCYNTTYHISIKMTPFKALYGYDAPSLTDMLIVDNKVPKAKDFIQQHHDILKSLKENIHMAQNRQKRFADQHRTECTFEVGDMVYLRLQPYRQSSLKKSGAEKLKP